MKNGKRILKVTIKQMLDDSPDTSYLGEYTDRADSDWSIDRAHSEDCPNFFPNQESEAKRILEHVQQTIADLHNAVLAQYNGTLANEKLDSERESLDNAYNEVGELLDTVDECDCSGYWDKRTYRYFNPATTEKNNTPEENRANALADYARMEKLNSGDFCYIGIGAEAEVQLTGDTVQRITSGSLWGIESDSGRDYLESVEQEELGQLKTELTALGFSKRAIAKAFQSIERK